MLTPLCEVWGRAHVAIDGCPLVIECGDGFLFWHDSRISLGSVSGDRMWKWRPQSFVDSKFPKLTYQIHLTLDFNDHSNSTSKSLYFPLTCILRYGGSDGFFVGCWRRTTDFEVFKEQILPFTGWIRRERLSNTFPSSLSSIMVPNFALASKSSPNLKS